VRIGIMIAIVGIKTRSIISARVSDKSVRREVKKLATWGAGIFSLLFPFPPSTAPSSRWNPN